jgi:tRNA(fMet)-specific endonuclease VapC
VSRVLLDTTYLVDAERSGLDLDQAIDDEDDVAIAAVTVAELRVGALLATGKRRTARFAFVDDVVRALDVVDYGVEVAEAHAELLVAVRSQGRPRGAHDLIIAASALATDREVVSADSSAFRDLPGIRTSIVRSD